MEAVSCVLMLVRLDRQGIEVIYNRRLGGWVWFNRTALKMALAKLDDDAMTTVHGPFASCWAAANHALSTTGPAAPSAAESDEAVAA